MTVGWGIAGTGAIAHDFAAALGEVDDARLRAVSSRSAERARAFAAQTGATAAYGSLDDLLADPSVDVLYVASPHSEHCREALAGVAAGKHVLVEKPFGLSADQVRPVLAAAERAGVFVMEALWSRFLPAHVRLRELVAEGAIGEVLAVEASLGFRFTGSAESRLLDPALGGGALLDVGLYPVNTAMQLLGPPRDVTASAVLGPTGVDLSTVVGLSFDSGAVAAASCSLAARLPCTAVVTGTTGAIELPARQHEADGLLVHSFGGPKAPPETTRLDLPAGPHGLHHQVLEVHRCLREGRQQSEVMSWAHTLELAAVLDRARAAIGLVYPGEA